MPAVPDLIDPPPMPVKPHPAVNGLCKFIRNGDGTITCATCGYRRPWDRDHLPRQGCRPRCEFAPLAGIPGYVECVWCRSTRPAGGDGLKAPACRNYRRVPLGRDCGCRSGRCGVPRLPTSTPASDPPASD